jgi:predicted permease
MMEGGVLVAASGAAGLLLAWISTRLLLTLSPLASLSTGSLLSPGVLTFGLGISALALLSFALVPALRVARVDLMNGLRGGSKLVTPGGGARLRSTLVVSQVAMSVVLLVAAGLLLRSFVLLQQVDLGYTRDRLVFAYMQHPVSEDSQEEFERTLRQRIAFYVGLLERLRGVPGVSAAAGVTFLPMGKEIRATRDMFVEGRSATQLGERPQAEFYAITPDFFATLGIPFRAGRDFSYTSDTRGGPPTAIVNEAFVRTVLGGEPALGRHVRWQEGGEWWEIVGVVGDARWQRPGLPPQPTLFVSSLTGIGTSLSVVARTSLDEEVVTSTLGSLVRELNPTVPVRLETMDDLLGSVLARPRFLALVVGVFAAFAGLLAAVGLFSVLAYMVGQRRRELAVRQALGARSADVLAMILGQGFRLVAAGLLLGLVAALAVTRLLQGLLYGVGPWDAATYAGAATALGVVALVATLLPARRAAAIAPLIALQDE